jgi:hypothetical protein
MKNVLSILTAVILFGFSFTFSSCKDCGKNKGKDNPDNPVIDGDNPDNPVIDGDEDAPVDLAEVERYLEAKGAGPIEIMEMIKIAKENFGKNIGHVESNRADHYYYRDDRGEHHGQSGAANCGLYAMKRFLFVLGRHNIVDKNLWYRHTDDELREMVFDSLGGEVLEVKNHNVTIDSNYLTTLMNNIGIPPKQCLVHFKGGGLANGAFLPRVLKKEEYAARMVEINKKREELRNKSQNILQTARAAAGIARAKVNASKADGLSENLKQQALQEAMQAKANIDTAEAEARRLRREAEDFASRMELVAGKYVFRPRAERDLLEAMVEEAGAAAREISYNILFNLPAECRSRLY